MRLETVTAHGFGPLAEESIALAPGFTIVVGDNEAGKSSWHSAIFAALCGRRRGRGRPTAEEQQFIDAHQPWDGRAWAVSCRLALDDGRQIELRQDLSGKVDCRATDMVLARDVSAEIMVDGSPDASVWLGLTRASFRATACVGQLEVLGVRAAADGLQDVLQRAASTAGASGTAAGAIAALEECRRTAVGRDSVAAIRPLRKAREAVSAAESRLAGAASSRAQFTDIAEAEERLAGEVRAALAQTKDAEAEVATLAAAVRAEERHQLSAAAADAPAAPPPAISARTASRKSGRDVRLRALVVLGLLSLAVALFGAAAAVQSLLLAGLGAIVGLAGAAGWWSAGAPRQLGLEVLPQRAEASDAPPEGSELIELRLQLAERQALAEAARRRHHEAALRAGRAEAVRAERASSLPSVAEAEESLAAARGELERVLELDETLDLTIGFLGRAQERVHREVVPELTELVRGWLPRLSCGRYTDVRMDPATLAVEVCGPSRDFRRADLQSHGTAEQIYLLLRLALAAQLTAGHDTCPLLLDDVTVHADPARTDEILDLLHELSADRQIVLFAQEAQVRRWARERLRSPQDALLVLDQVRAR